MNARWHMLVCCAGLAGTRLLPAAEPAPGQDVIFNALQDELKRSMSLRLEDIETPYFLQYGVDDVETHRITATHGGLVSSTHDHSRVLRTQIRVGTYELDNSNFAGGARRGSDLASSAELPLEDDYLALRHAIWRATDPHYKSAVEVLTQKRGYLKDRNLVDRPNDFTRSGAVTAIEERVTWTFETARWEDYARRVSDAFSLHRHIQHSEVSLAAGVENRYLVNSEGSRLRGGTREALLRITAETQAEDGQRLSDQLTYFARTAEQLPPIDHVLADVQKLAGRLAATMRAPILEEYTGPVLVDGLAAAQLFRQLLSRGVAGQVDPVGVARRGPSGPEDLVKRLGKRILPTSVRVYDDPRQPTFQGVPLAGHYRVDDEAVPAQRVDLVADGKLQAMLMSRAPTKQFAQSNGHSRRGGGESPRTTIGCLFIESREGRSADELKKALLEAADAEGLEYGLKVTGIQGREAGGAGEFGFLAARFRRGGAGARAVGDPVEVYKVYVADGREELVRGCEFSSLDERSLRRISAVGRTPVVLNSAWGFAPSSSVIAPAILFEEVDLVRIEAEAEKKPMLAAPHAR